MTARTEGSLLAVLIIATTVLHMVAAQFGGCQCDGPPCLEVPQRTPSGAECIKMPRPDCPCCLVCAHQQGEQCDDLSQPCDLSSRLFCNTTSGLCQKGKTRLRKVSITAMKNSFRTVLRKLEILLFLSSRNRVVHFLKMTFW